MVTRMSLRRAAAAVLVDGRARDDEASPDEKAGTFSPRFERMRCAGGDQRLLTQDAFAMIGDMQHAQALVSQAGKSAKSNGNGLKMREIAMVWRTERDSNPR